MKHHLIVLSLAGTLGCAHGFGKGIDLVDKGAAATGVVITESTNLWAAGVDAQIALCKAQLGDEATEAQRAECMGRMAEGDKAEAHLEMVRDGYDLIAEGLEKLKTGAKALEPYLGDAKKAATK